MAVYAFSAHRLGLITLDLFDSACQTAGLAPGVLGALSVASEQSSKAVLARVVVIELTTHARADTGNDVSARLQMRLVVLVSTPIGVEVSPSLGIVERKLELSSVTLVVVYGRMSIARGRVFARVGHVVLGMRAIRRRYGVG